MQPAKSEEDLIVGFPRQSSETNNFEVAEKFVRFSKYSTAKNIAYPTREQISAKWYSKADEDRFKRDIMRDATICSMWWMEGIEGKKITKDLLMECVGLDHLMSDDVMERYREVQMTRRIHVQTVLNEQKLQRELNALSSSRLAHVAKQSSQWPRERAQMTAEMFLKARI